MALARGGDASTSLLPEELGDADERTLRHSYYSNIMKLHECVKLNDDGSLTGVDCPSTLVVFGPYIAAPANSNVQVHFDVEAPSQLSVMSDVLSDGAKQFHGAFDDRDVRPNERTSVHYRIHLFDAVRALEARVGIRSGRPASFRITNYKLTID